MEHSELPEDDHEQLWQYANAAGGAAVLVIAFVCSRMTETLLTGDKAREIPLKHIREPRTPSKLDSTLAVHDSGNRGN